MTTTNDLLVLILSIGQKRVVNVFRLITKNTLEEKIMGLQRFKLNIANTVVTSDNAGGGFGNMPSEELLNLFAVDDTTSTKDQNRKREKLPLSQQHASIKKSKVSESHPGLDKISTLMTDLDALTTVDSLQDYEEAFDMKKFLKGLG